MNQSHLIVKEKILALESSFEVDQWIVNGIHIWPYVRIKLYFLLLRNSNLEPNTDNSANDNRKNKIDKKWIDNLKLALNLVTGLFRVESFFLSLKKKKIVFFGAHFHRVKHGQEYFNRFFDAMVSHHQLEKEVYMIEYQKVYQYNYNQKAIIPLERLLEDFKLVMKLKAQFQSQRNNYSLNDYQDFLSVVEDEIENTKMLKITIKDLLKWSTKIQNLAIFYKRFYLKVKPDKIIFSGYFGWDDLYAAVLTANNLNIKTIDFQHGTQSNVHMVFSSWTKMPLEGFNIMPKQYWSWDEKSKVCIDYWAKNTSNIITKVVGQPYLQYWKQKNSNLKPENKVILYTLNLMPLSEMFNKKLGESINDSECSWAIRLHPRNEFSIDDIKFYLDSLGVDKRNYDIHDAKEVPLPEIMSKAVIHITAFSGSVIEAKMMGVPSVIINSIGKEIYKDYIDSEFIYFINQTSTSFKTDFLRLFHQIKENKYIFEKQNIVNPLLT
ncbi:hypothetical protein [Flavobacterium acetivorans]|uniref:hypothetical protein n=1 Tax=Flavobacterium acetivorans TaxID=2893883 RepID=UPI001E329270|nr:hypothetical protein [Flavobacterium sp. F-29]UFH35712.1 hypothetical protein LNP19_01400 [Flavobacterium sp. F-29]